MLGFIFPTPAYRQQLLAGMLILNVWFRWESLLLLLPLLVLATLCFTFLGMIVSNLAQNETQVSMINNVVTLPMMFASEVFYSLSAAPGWVKGVGRLFPLSYLVDGEKTALLGFTLLTLALAVVTFRWDPDASPMRRILRVRAAS